MKRTTKDIEDIKKRKAEVEQWDAKITDAKEKSKSWWLEAQKSFNEYLGEKGETDSSSLVTKAKTKYPIWWSSIKTVQPALYSRTPTTVANALISDAEDPVARLASSCLERLSKQLMQSTPFDRVMYYTRDMYLHSARTAPRVCFKSKLSKEKVYIDPNVQPLDGNTQYFQEPETGKIYSEVEKLDTCSVNLEPMHFRDVLHNSSARHQEEVEWMAFKSLMDKEDAKERFGDKAEVLKFNYSSSAEEEQKDSDKSKLDKLACIWEIWDKRKKKVYWYSPEYKEDFLDVKDDPYGLVGFFPMPAFMLGTVGCDSLYPVPDYSQLEPLINQLNGMFNRYRTLIIALKRKGVFDSNVPELAALADSTSEAEYIGIKNFADLIRDGDGLSRLVAHFPTKEFSSAIVELSNVIQDFEQKFYEQYGIPDILRGTSDPRETAAAQQQKGRFVSLRFSAIQREFQRMARDSIELMIDLALKLFPDDKLADLMGFNYFKPEEQELIPQVLELLRNDSQRQMRIDIETDSTITMNEESETAQRNVLAQTLFDGLNSMKGLTQENPALLPVVGETILYVIRGLRNGKQVEGALSGVIKQMLQPPPPPEPPPPDPMLQKIQMEGQLRVQEMQQDGQIRQAELQLKGQTLQLEQMKLEREFALKEQELIIAAQKVASESNLESVKVSMAQQQQVFQQEMDKLKQELDSFKVISSEKEKLQTERRLEREEQRQQIETLTNHLQNSQPPISLTVEAAKPTRKKVRITKDPLGGTIIESDELEGGRE